MKNLLQKVNFLEIPSFKYRHFIKTLSKPFYKIPNFAGTTIAILLKSGEMAWLSTTPKTTLKIISAGLNRGDLLLQNENINVSRVIFPEEFVDVDETQSAINSILKSDGLYRGYCISRSCPDCSVMVSYNVTTESVNHRALYENTIDALEIHVNEFLDKTISIYSELLPALSHSQFAANTAYRHQIMTTRHAVKASIHLSDTELDVLYWSAQGKSASEIAVITGLTKNTVDTYRQRLTEKLGAENITQAVYIAAKSGFIA